MADDRTSDMNRRPDEDAESVNVDGDLHAIAESSVSIGSDGHTETTESTRSLVQRNMEERKGHEVSISSQEASAAEKGERPREKSPESDVVPPSIGPVVLREVKKRRKLDRTCA